MKGLRRQHRFSRTADGWCENARDDDDGAKLNERDDLVGLSEEQLAAVRGTGKNELKTWADAQQEADKCAKEWAVQWGSELEQMEDIQWPEDMGEPPPELWSEAILEAAMTFPTDTGLGWDGIHPRCLKRISKELVAWLVLILKHAEATGTWQAAVELVVIVLLPKPDGGFRPIGLLPPLQRLWMRTGKKVVVKWARANQWPYLYAGKGRGGGGHCGMEAGGEG